MTTITTDRLILRPLTLDDAEAAFEWTGDERVAKYMIYSTHESVETTKEWLRSINTSDTVFEFGFVRRSDDKLIGSGGIRLKEDGLWEFGYNFRYDCWGQGYATEASKAMIELVRSRFGEVRFKAECAAENTASAHVIEKCGLHFVGYGEYSSYDGLKTFRSKKFEL
ncbi:GNAT family N-acetyltransferase [uncultured Ruminococcus sp.]|uniref:GNAT family N-acetyltransferase n=1 Tax=uncultured Ruminococcus sp. TaxID=165186 RepID=UPI0025CE93D5|nr:GNAT family N-acetyltransferase [uncultured Ruminococcus sp.]